MITKWDVLNNFHTVMGLVYMTKDKPSPQLHFVEPQDITKLFSKGEFEQLVIDNEIFGMSLRTLRAPIFTIDDETLALDLIEEIVKQEGKTNFLAQPHTRDYFRKGEHMMPNYKVSERNSTEEWKVQCFLFMQQFSLL